jgi:hypothetical protein
LEASPRCFASAAGCWLRDQLIRFVPQSAILKSLVALANLPE